MAGTRLWLLGLVLGVAVALLPEDDFAFESPDEEHDLLSPISHPHPTSAPVQRLWGVPDSVTSVGKLFRLSVPTDAFSGNLDHYEARGQGGGPLPSWLLFDKATGVFEGVPGARDVGEHYITVRALGLHPQDSAKDVFSIEVYESTGVEVSLATDGSPLLKQLSKVKCDPGEDPTILTILMDVKYEHMKPKQRVLAIKNLSGFLALHQTVFTIQAHNSQDDLLSDAVVLAGPGNIKRKATKQSSAIRWQVGCEGRLWKQHAMLAQQLRQQARDGTLAEVLQQPVVGWHVKTETSAGHRERRETGSGDFVDDDDPTYDYGEGDEEDSETVPETRIVPTMSSPVFPEATVSHAHRHHHGETVEQLEPGSDINTVPGGLQPSATYRLPTSPVLYGTILPTPVLVPIRPTRLMSSEAIVEPSRVYKEYAEVTPSATPVFVTEVESSITTEIPTSQVTEPLPTSSSSSSSGSSSSSSSGSTTGSTGASSSSSTTEITSTTEEATTPTPLITEKASTPKPTDEVVEYDIKNIQPTIEQRLPKLPITAGKAFRFQIPEEAFSDLEDGNTRNLRLIFKTQEGTSVPSSSWVQFDPVKQEVYALPLEEQVSKWEYVLEAMDKEGKSVSDTLALQVQHHKGRRTVNHEFSIFLRVDKIDFPSDVDWQLQIVEKLAELYGDPNPGQITVRAINMTNDPIVFTWTNDSLPRNHCPKETIEKLFMVLVLNKNGDPSPGLKDVLSTNMDVKKVTYHGLGQCDKRIHLEALPAPPLNPTENFPPVTRNQVDHINATVGELLSFIVPEDSFYDPEDGSARNLKLSLMTIDSSPILPTHWLQFDVRNQQFYGIPMPGDLGRKEYQLVGKDTGGLTAYDGLVVEVHPAAKILYNVEFNMTLGVEYETFVSSASMKRKFVEKLSELFDKNTSAIVLKNISKGSTVVTWTNRSLPTDNCPEAEIRKLRKVLVKNDGETVTDRVKMMGVDFNGVKRIGLTPMGVCLGELTKLHTPEVPSPPVKDPQPVEPSDDYLVTYVVPAVIIVAMLLLAGVVACVLYRRRRTGKMSVGDEDERQSFRNKGIPVIFQDELEERPDPGNKSPVIMKEEKPPLPPPEYQRGELEHATPPPTATHPLLGETATSEDPPYQPPPPFTTSRDSGRQNRPKPTPTYRKPPPYVPP